MKKKSKVDNLSDLLSPKRLTEVVDIGANPLGEDPPYKPLLSAGLCRVTGFEPQEEPLSKLQKSKSSKERYLPYAVGDGSIATLNICATSGMTSVLEPDPKILELFSPYSLLGAVVEKVPVQTRKLDDITEIKHLDFLKIDIQGGELKVFQGGSGKLSEAVVVQTEISFVTLYKNQPCSGEIDLEMRRQGFIPHSLENVKKWPISPCLINNRPDLGLNQILEADIVYVRDFSRPELMSDEQLKHLAIIAHYCYGSYDLAYRCVMLLEQRHVLEKGSQAKYLQSLSM